MRSLSARSDEPSRVALSISWIDKDSAGMMISQAREGKRRIQLHLIITTPFVFANHLLFLAEFHLCSPIRVEHILAIHKKQNLLRGNGLMMQPRAMDADVTEP